MKPGCLAITLLLGACAYASAHQAALSISESQIGEPAGWRSLSEACGGAPSNDEAESLSGGLR
jgi:hypothetical protein